MCSSLVNFDKPNKKYLKPRTRFGETTFGNCITFTIDGQQNFKLMYEKMRQAKSSIYIANYDLDPDLQPLRGDTQSFQISDLVASPCLSESSITYDESNNDSFNSSLHNDGDKKHHTLQDLLIEKAKQKISKSSYGNQDP